MPSVQASQLNCQPPSTAPAATAGQDQFDQYSWQMFIALSWPAKSGQRGNPDCTQQPGAAGYTVWQTYKTVGEIFLPNATNPGPWNSPQIAKSFNIINIASLKNSAQVNAVDQAVGGWLIDQAKTRPITTFRPTRPPTTTSWATTSITPTSFPKPTTSNSPGASSRSNRAGASSPPMTTPAVT